MSVRSVETEHAGGQAGVEVVLTPLGARAILGMPLRELADVMVPLDAVLGRRASLWVDELAAARDWTERFAILDRILIARLGGAADVPPPLVRAMNGLTESAGQVRVDSLAAGVGWSRRHLSRAGYTPAQWVVRFTG